MHLSVHVCGDAPLLNYRAEMEPAGTLGIIVNPHSGRDARRLFARAGTSTMKRVPRPGSLSTVIEALMPSAR